MSLQDSSRACRKDAKAVKRLPEFREPSHVTKELDMESMEEAVCVVAVAKQLYSLSWLQVLIADLELLSLLIW